mmetsp:Transcript_20381/g.34789  ORF Transcript_20381/g.34789 Transcript_20381/m.34789 type:complete len:272 (-) Transcript_20381:478-1293(-)
MFLNVRFQKRFKHRRTADQTLQIVEKRKAFVVRHGRERVVGIDAVEVRHQLGELVIGTKQRDAVAQCLAPQHRGKVALRRAKDAPDDGALDEHREAFVEPKMFPCAVRNQIAAPRVCDFVRHHVGQRTVARNQCRCHKRQRCVFHTSIRKRRWQEQNVVLTPHVIADQLFASLEKLFSVGKLVRTGLHHRRFTPHFGAGTDVARLQRTHCQRNEVRRNRDVLTKRVAQACAVFVRFSVGRWRTHQRHQWRRHTHCCFIRQFDSWRILNRNH